jgi:hypothetical protein
VTSLRAKVLAIGCLLWVALVVEATEFAQYSRNDLLTNGRWVSSKPLMQMPLMGAFNFELTRNALHRNQLHLAEWHGFNEVHLNELVQVGEIEYRFRLDPGAYIYFIFNRSETGQHGIRLSRNKNFPSMFYAPSARTGSSTGWLFPMALGARAGMTCDSLSAPAR